MKIATITRVAGMAAIGTVAVLAPAAHAGAAPYPNGGDTPDVAPQTTQVSPGSASKPATLPFTGGDIAQLAALGAASVGAGTFVVRRSRRHTSA
jgi:hypothetical protein